MTTQTPSRELRIGDRLLTIEEPNGYKFITAAEQISAISEAVPDWERRNSEFIREHRARTELRYTKEQAIAAFPQAFADMPADFWTSRNDEFVLPGEMPGNELQFLAMFRQVFAVAKDPVLRLVTVLAAPGAELEQADAAGNLDDYLARFQRTLLHQCKISTLALVLMRAVQAMQAEFSADAEAAAALGEIRGFFRGRTTTEDTQTPSEPPPSQPPASGPSEPGQSGPTPAASPSDNGQPDTRPDSSTSSPPPTAGPATTSSSAPAGE